MKTFLNRMFVTIRLKWFLKHFYQRRCNFFSYLCFVKLNGISFIELHKARFLNTLINHWLVLKHNIRVLYLVFSYNLVTSDHAHCNLFLKKTYIEFHYWILQSVSSVHCCTLNCGTIWYLYNRTSCGLADQPNRW